MSFFNIYAKKKFKQGVRELRDAVVSFDPDTAGEVAVAEMEEKFDLVNKEYSDAKRTHDDEANDVVEIERKQTERLEKANQIQAKITGGDTNPRLQTALDSLIENLEDMAPDIEHEKAEAAEAKAAMDELKEVVDMYATKLKNTRRDVKKMSSQMARAERQQALAKQREDRARLSAGLTSDDSGMSSVLESMKRQAADAAAKADAANRKADLLGTTDVDSMVDDLLGDTKPTMSASERLAALNKK